MSSTGGGAYGAGMAGKAFDPIEYIKKPQVILRIASWVQVVSSFSLTDILKTEFVTKHESRQGDNSHTYALMVMRDAKHMEVAKITAISKFKNAIISAMRNTFFAAYYNHDG